MKQELAFIAVVSVVLSVTLHAGKGEKYGKDLTIKSVTKISNILANPKKFDGKKVLVEGTVLDVCTDQGCWIMISGEKENESIRFKVEDGVISVKTLSKEKQIQQGEYHAKEEGKTFDSSSVQGPKTVVQIEGEGAVIQ